MKKALIFTATFLLLILTSVSDTHAKRRLPHAKPLKSSGGSVVRSTRGITVRPKFRGDRLAIIITFSNLSIARSIDYTLSYNSRGITQGAGGALSPDSPDPLTRELIFGSCSHGVCRYDSGITNARLTITTTLKNGLKIVKRFRLKV